MKILYVAFCIFMIVKVRNIFADAFKLMKKQRLEEEDRMYWENKYDGM